jgi:hypothetical protein
MSEEEILFTCISDTLVLSEYEYSPEERSLVEFVELNLFSRESEVKVELLLRLLSLAPCNKLI